ncbi:MAG: hypothetical protein N2039_08665 [Gemmataceae bacterium]|nr:hypothetical protein [Gemmataceae bacterium]
MTIDEALQSLTNLTVDGQGRLAQFTFTKDRAVGHLQARLPKNFLALPNPTIEWVLHWRDDRGMEQRLISTDVHSLLKRFGPVDLLLTPAHSLDEVLQPV